MDGFFRANWKIDERDGVAKLTIDRLRRVANDPPGAVEAVEEEGLGLLEFTFPDATERRVEFEPLSERRPLPSPTERP